MPNRDIRDVSATERAQRVLNDGRRVWNADSQRRGRYLSNLSRYEGRTFTSLSPATGYVSTAGALDRARVLIDAADPETWLRVNVSRSLVRAVTSKIAAVQQPKVLFVTSGADWTTRRKSRLLDQFVEGSFAQRHEPYADVWDLGTTVFRDSVIFGIGAIKTWADIEAGRIVRDRILPWELLVDSEESQYGDPVGIWHTYRANRRSLQAWFPEFKAELEDAPSDALEDSVYYLRGESRDMLRVWEYWRKPDGPKSPGCHVLVVQGIEVALIDDLEFETDIPITVLRWDRDVRGFWGTSLCDEARSAEDEYNLTLVRMARALRSTSMGICFYEEGTLVKDDALDSADALSIPYQRGATPPTYTSPPPFSPAHSQWAELWHQTIYDATGVNQMSATGNRQAGADSGVAIKTLVDMQSEIFATSWRNYQLMYVDLARKAIDVGHSLAEQTEDWSVQWAGDGFLRQIPWKKVDMASDQYTVQIQSAPSGKGSAFERVKTGEELFGAGMITQDALLAIKQYYDTPGEVDRVTLQRRLVDSWIERWLDADEEQLESGEYSPGVPLIIPPIRFMRSIEDAIVQVADAYQQALLDGAPDENLSLFLTWLETADAVLTQKQQKLAAAQAPPVPPGSPAAAPSPIGPSASALAPPPAQQAGIQQ